MMLMFCKQRCEGALSGVTKCMSAVNGVMKDMHGLEASHFGTVDMIKRYFGCVCMNITCSDTVTDVS
jgi:hypothetical protein